MVLRAEVVKIGEGEGISGAAFKPLGGVNSVAGFAAAEEEVEAVDPEAVIDEADGDDAADAEGFAEDGGGLVEFFEGAGADDAVEVGGGELAHEVQHVALVGGHAAADAGGDFGDVEVNADGGDLFGLGEGFEEDAATAAEIEHAGARRHPIGDDLLIDGAFDGEFGHGGGAGGAGDRSWDLGGDEAADEVVELGGFEEEGVVAEVGGEFGVAGGFTGAEEGGGDGAVLGGGEEPVAGEADDEGRSGDGGEGGLEGGGAGGEVEGVESAGDIEVAVGVEAVDEAAALVAQVALDLETHVEGVEAGGGVFGDLAAAKFTVHAGVTEVGDVGHHTGDGEAHARAGAGGVVAALPARVLEDGLASDLVEGDGLSALATGGGKGDEPLDEAGEKYTELEDLHAAHGATDGGA